MAGAASSPDRHKLLRGNSVPSREWNGAGTQTRGEVPWESIGEG